MGTRPDTEHGWHRLRPARTVLAVALTLVALSAGWLALRAAVATDGGPVLSDPGFGSGLTIHPLAKAGTSPRANDIVVAVNGVPIDEWLGTRMTRPRVHAGSEFTYRLKRDRHELTAAVVLHRNGLAADRWRESGGPLLAAVAVLALGLFSVYRRPDRMAARALLVLGAGLVAYTVFITFGYDTADVVGARIVFGFGFVGAAASLTIWSAAAAHLALTFPEPPPVLRRRPWRVAGLYAAPLAITAAAPAALLVSGRATLARLDNLTTVSSLVLTILGVITLAGLVRTIVRGARDAAVRAQSLLVALGLVVTVVVLLIANLVAGDKEWPAWLPLLAFLPLPVTVTVAIVRGEFLGIRAVVNRTLVYGSLTAILLAAYVGVVTAVGAVAGDTGVVPTLFATGLVAVAFAPLRGSLQRAVDRLLYGQRGDPARVLGALGHRLEAEVRPDEVLPAITETVATTLNLPYVALRTGSGPDARLACERGEPVTDTHVVPLMHQGRTVGELVVAARRGERSISGPDKVLLADMARQIATAVSAAGLFTDLTASRSRLAVAREEERARLRHDLHDRLGPHLVGLSLQLDALQSRAGDGDTAQAVGRAYDEVTRALDEVRRISRGLRPAELEELGLVEAIAAAAARLTVADDDLAWKASIDAAVQLGTVPADIEAAAYQIALEALSNAYRHSGGHLARVRLGIDAAGSALTIEVADDGNGIDHRAPPGVGIQSMRERAAGVHGHLAITNTAGGGTTVRATLPLADPRR